MESELLEALAAAAPKLGQGRNSAKASIFSLLDKD
jgi:hypothetical protein